MTSTLADLAEHLEGFLALVEPLGWSRRLSQLVASANASPYQARIVRDYNWLELALHDQAAEFQRGGGLLIGRSDPRVFAALQFAAAVVEMHKALDSPRRATLKGRLRDGLRTDTGFPSLFQEVDMAMLLMEQGFDVDFRGLDGSVGPDLKFTTEGASGEVECKSLSADAGRKIHRDDFYRFIDTLRHQIVEAPLHGARVGLLITLHDRLPRDEAPQASLRAAVLGLLKNAWANALNGSFFSARRFDTDTLFWRHVETTADLHKVVRRRYGDYCHVAGMLSEGGSCLIVMRSALNDDTSKPLLDSITKGIGQLSPKLPGYVAVQFNDITAQDLLLDHLRRRTRIISNHLFHTRASAHVMAIYFSAYAGLQLSAQGAGNPGFLIVNPRSKWLGTTALPFGRDFSDAEFAKLLGKQPDPRPQ